MTSTAVRDFCTATRESEIIRARRKQENHQAIEARKAAEQLLVETLGAGTRFQTTVDDAPYVVAVKVRETFPSFSSSVTERLQSLWENTGALRDRLEDSDAEDVVGAFVKLLLLEAGGMPRRTTQLDLAPLRKGADRELANLPQDCGDLAIALVRAKSDLGRGKAEFSDESKRLQQVKSNAEEELIQELSGLEAGQVKRVNMLEADGTTQSYYLRLKRPKTSPKRKITVKTLKTHIEKLVVSEVDPMRIAATIETLCSVDFGTSFLTQLKGSLSEHETPADTAEGVPREKTRVALDRIRAPK